MIDVEDPQSISFDRNALATSLDADQALRVTSGASGNGYAWLQWGGTTGTLNSFITYTRSDTDDYRTWSPEVTHLPGNMGLFVSCKIDFIRPDPDKDDHILLMMGFLLDGTSRPKPAFAQASVQFGGASDENIVGTPIKGAAPGSTNVGDTDFAQAITDQLKQIIAGEDFGWINDSTDSRNALPEIAGDNVTALIASVQGGA